MAEEYELDWKEYEAITKYIYTSLGKRDGIKIIGYGQNCKIKGKSTIEHQVDVLTEQFDGQKRLLTAIECKYWNKKVDEDVVMKLAGIMEDSDITSGIIVCKSGYTPNTLTYAAYKGIKLVELWEAGENDNAYNKTFELGTLNINIGAIVSRGVVTSVDFGDKRIDVANEEEMFAMHNVILHDLNGNTISLSKFLGEFSKERQRRGELLKTMTIDYPLNRKLLLKHDEGETSFQRISITGHFAKLDKSSKRSFALTDQVWMIMKELFDKRHLALSKSGLIWNLSHPG
ncbi:hypothetical protein GCM10027037_05820 [Mucilaginibacter koreensis]